MFVEAYDPETGKKLPYLVPEHHIDHPVLGARLARLPSAVKSRRDSGPTEAPELTEEPTTPARARRSRTNRPVETTETPALGDNQKKE